jgi:hypothetical protein
MNNSKSHVSQRLTGQENCTHGYITCWHVIPVCDWCGKEFRWGEVDIKLCKD